MPFDSTRQVHLPDEECSSCGMEVPASKIRNHKRECKGEEKPLKGEVLLQQTSNFQLKRKLESDMMVGGNLLNTSQLGSAEKQKTMKMSLETDLEGNVVEVEKGNRTSGIDPPQNISIRYGSTKYSVQIMPERKMRRVMKKMAKMLGKQVDQLVFKVERSGKVIKGEETMKEFAGEDLFVQ